MENVDHIINTNENFLKAVNGINSFFTEKFSEINDNILYYLTERATQGDVFVTRKNVKKYLHHDVNVDELTAEDLFQLCCLNCNELFRLNLFTQIYINNPDRCIGLLSKLLGLLMSDTPEIKYLENNEDKFASRPHIRNANLTFYDIANMIFEQFETTQGGGGGRDRGLVYTIKDDRRLYELFNNLHTGGDFILCAFEILKRYENIQVTDDETVRNYLSRLSSNALVDNSYICLFAIRCFKYYFLINRPTIYHPVIYMLLDNLMNNRIKTCKHLRILFKYRDNINVVIENVLDLIKNKKSIDDIERRRRILYGYLTRLQRLCETDIDDDADNSLDCLIAMIKTYTEIRKKLPPVYRPPPIPPQREDEPIIIRTEDEERERNRRIERLVRNFSRGTIINIITELGLSDCGFDNHRYLQNMYEKYITFFRRIRPNKSTDYSHCYTDIIQMNTFIHSEFGKYKLSIDQPITDDELLRHFDKLLPNVGISKYTKMLNESAEQLRLCYVTDRKLSISDKFCFAFLTLRALHLSIYLSCALLMWQNFRNKGRINNEIIKMGLESIADKIRFANEMCGYFNECKTLLGI